MDGSKNAIRLRLKTTIINLSFSNRNSARINNMVVRLIQSAFDPFVIAEKRRSSSANRIKLSVTL